MMSMSKRVRALTWLTWIVAFTVAAASLTAPVGAQQSSPAGVAEGTGAGPVPSGNATGGEPLATVAFVSGQVGVWREGGDSWTMVDGPYSLYMNDHVRTGTDSRAVLEFTDGSEVMMHEQTTLQIAPRSPVDEPKGVAARIKVSLGQIFNRVTPGQSDLEFETPDAVAAIRGTDFLIGISESANDPATEELMVQMFRGWMTRSISDEEMPAFLHGYVEQVADELDERLRETLRRVIATLTANRDVSDETLRTLIESVGRTVEEGRRAGRDTPSTDSRLSSDLDAARDEQQQAAQEEQRLRQQELLERQQELWERQQELMRERATRAELEQQALAARQRAARDQADRQAAGRVAGPEDGEQVPGQGPISLAEALLLLMQSTESDGESIVADWAVRWMERQLGGVIGGVSAPFGPDSAPPRTLEEMRELIDDLLARAAAEAAEEGDVERTAQLAALHETVVLVLEGRVELSNLLGSVLVGAGQRTSARADRAPDEPTDATPEEMDEATGWVDELDEERGVTGEEPEEADTGPGDELGDADGDESADGPPTPDGVGVFVPAGDAPPEADDGDDPEDPGDGEDPEDPEDPVDPEPVTSVEVEASLDYSQVAIGSSVAYEARVRNAGDTDINWLMVRISMPPVMAVDREQVESFVLAGGDTMLADAEVQVSTDSDGRHVDVVFEGSPGNEPGQRRGLRFPIEVGEIEGEYEIVTVIYLDPLGDASATTDPLPLRVVSPPDTRPSISGRITRGDNPVASHRVGLWSMPDGGEPGVGGGGSDVDWEETDEDGYYEFRVEPGEYALLVGTAAEQLGSPEFASGASIGDVLAWMRTVAVDADLTVDFDLAVGYGITFDLATEHSVWGVGGEEEGGLLTRTYEGGQSADDVFLLRAEDLDGSPLGLTLAESVDSNLLSGLSEGEWGLGLVPEGGSGADVLEMDEGFSSSIHKWPGDDGEVFRIVLSVDSPEHGRLSVLGPALVSRQTPVAEELDWIHFVHGHGDDLQFTLYGNDLDLVTGVILSVDGGQSWIDIEPESAGVTPLTDEGTATVNIPWDEVAVGDDPSTGWHDISLVAGPSDGVFSQGSLRLLVTSSDLSGNAPGTTLTRGDLHRSASEVGPEGALMLKNRFDLVETIEETTLSFADEYVVVTNPESGTIHVLSLVDGSDAPHVGASVGLAGSPSASGLSRMYFQPEGPSHGPGLASATPGQSSSTMHVDADGAFEVGDVVVHDGVLVVLVQDSDAHIAAFDADIPNVPLATAFDVGNFGRLAVSVRSGGADSPLVHYVTNGSIWTGDLYTLERRWSTDFSADDPLDTVEDFVVSPDGQLLYVLENPYDGRLRVRAFETDTGYETWDADFSDNFDGPVKVFNNTLAVDPEDGTLFTFVAVENDGEWMLYGIALSADLVSIDIVKGFALPGGIDPWGAGLVFAHNTGHAYGFVTGWMSDSPHSALFRFTTEQVDEGEGAAFQAGADFLDGFEESSEGIIAGLALARGMVWFVKDGIVYSIYDESHSGTDWVDPPLIKRADKATAQIGDVITYTITFDNTDSVDNEPIVDQTNVWIQDVLPPGFILVEGSTYVHPDGVGGGAAPVAMAPGAASTGRVLQFHLTDGAAGGTIPEHTMRALTYQVIVGPRVIEGATYTNEAVGYADGANTTPGWLDNACHPSAPGPDCDFILTNVARADVHIAPGVFAPRATVVGKVFHDIDGDGAQGPGEPGIAGVRIVMETGVSVVTDGFGKFSLSNLTPGLHVLMLDESSLSLPDGSGGTSGSSVTLRAGAGGPFRLLDLTGGGLFTVNFPVEE